jgi:hypothetical protein
MKCVVCDGHGRLWNPNIPMKQRYEEGVDAKEDCPNCGGGGDEPEESVLTEKEKSYLHSRSTDPNRP